jgi:hypothetical protein
VKASTVLILMKKFIFVSIDQLSSSIVTTVIFPLFEVSDRSVLNQLQLLED